MNFSFRLVSASITVLLLLVACGSPSESSKSSNGIGAGEQTGTIMPSEAKGHVGETKTVCGQVVDSRYLSGGYGKNTSLYFDKPAPEHPFMVVILGMHRYKFPSDPEKHYLNKQVCARGLIENNTGSRGKPQITAVEEDQLSIGN